MSEIKIDTIVRTVLLVVALVNQALTLCGKSPLPFADEQIADFVSFAITGAASLWAWWKNNSFTKNAIEADKVLAQLKSK
jgi:SPP1 family holin